MYLSWGWRSLAMRHGNHERRHNKTKRNAQSLDADAIEGAAEPCRLDGPTDGACDIRGKPFVDEEAMEPWRWRSQSLSFARTSIFENDFG